MDEVAQSDGSVATPTQNSVEIQQEGPDDLKPQLESVGNLGPISEALQWSPSFTQNWDALGFQIPMEPSFCVRAQSQFCMQMGENELESVSMTSLFARPVIELLKG